MRKLSLIAAAAAALAAAPAQASLPEVAAHLRAARSMTANFTQTAADGGTATGRMLLEQPGKVRFQYEKAPILVVSDGRTLSMVDYEVAQVTRWPVRNTPLAVLLDPRLDLARYARVVGDDVSRAITVEAKDAEHPEYGTTTMTFVRDASAPGGLRLAGWRVLDAQGNTTQVELSNVRFNVEVDDSNFRFRDPRGRSAPGRR